MPNLPVLTLGRALAMMGVFVVVLLAAGRLAESITNAHQCPSTHRCAAPTWLDSTEQRAAEVGNA